jgi:hypothetical protein
MSFRYVSLLLIQKNNHVLGMPSIFAREALGNVQDAVWTDFLNRLSRQAGAHQTFPLSTQLVSDDGPKRLIFTTSESPTLALSCRLRLSTLALLTRYYPFILSLGLCGLGVLGLSHYVKATGKRREITMHLLQDVSTALHRQAMDFKSGKAGLPGIPTTQLRDHFIVAVGGLDAEGRTLWAVDETRGVWEGVRKGVAGNANVRETVMRVEGEEMEVWQWVGSGGLVPGSAKVVRGKDVLGDVVEGEEKR